MKRKKKSKKTETTEVENNSTSEISIDDRYKAYQKRKVAVFVTFFVVIALFIVLGIFNVFFKHTLTATEATSATLKATQQTNVQSWDSAVAGYLNLRASDLLKDHYTTASNSKDQFDRVENIQLIKNLQGGVNQMVAFFNADVVFRSGHTINENFVVNLIVDNNQLKNYGPVQISNYQYVSTEEYKYDKDDENAVVSNLAWEAEDRGTNDPEADAVIKNALTLALNTEEGGSSVNYQDNKSISIKGKYKELANGLIHKEKNNLGLNYECDLTLTYDDVTYTTKFYAYLVKDGSTYVIEKIL